MGAKGVSENSKIPKANETRRRYLMALSAAMGVETCLANLITDMLLESSHVLKGIVAGGKKS